MKEAKRKLIHDISLVILGIMLGLFFYHTAQARQFVVTWYANPACDSVLFYRTFRNDSLIYTGLDTFCVDTTIENGKKYWYTVQAVNIDEPSFLSAPVYGMWLSWNWDLEIDNPVSININLDGLYQLDTPPGDRWSIDIEGNKVVMRSTFDKNKDGFLTLTDFGALTDEDILYFEDFAKLYGKPCVWIGER